VFPAEMFVATIVVGLVRVAASKVFAAIDEGVAAGMVAFEER